MNTLESSLSGMQNTILEHIFNSLKGLSFSALFDRLGSLHMTMKDEAALALALTKALESLKDAELIRGDRQCYSLTHLGMCELLMNGFLVVDEVASGFGHPTPFAGTGPIESTQSPKGGRVPALALPPSDIPPNRKGQWLRATTDCFPLELGKTGLDSSTYGGELTGASLSTATKHETAGALTSEEPAHSNTPEISGTPGIISTEFDRVARVMAALPEKQNGKVVPIDVERLNFEMHLLHRVRPMENEEDGPEEEA